MNIQRNSLARSSINGEASAARADACFEAMQRHSEHGRRAATARAEPAGSSPFDPAEKAGPGDVIYGARAIAQFIFTNNAETDADRARRRVFNLWTYYRDRNERAGFFKLKGALCLSKSQWRRFHGLD